MNYKITSPIALTAADTDTDIVKSITSGKNVACCGYELYNPGSADAVVTVKIGTVVIGKYSIAPSGVAHIAPPGIYVLSDTVKLIMQTTVAGVVVVPCATEEY